MQDSIYSKNIQAGGRTYFFDIRQTKGGEKYLHITESRPQGTGNLRNNIVILISLDVILGVIAALKNKEFALGKLAGFMKKGILAYVFGFAILVLVGQVIPSLSLMATVAYFLILLALVGSILDNLGKLGLPIPKMLKK